MKRKAFTLIELLVVIAIIAILAAILFPVFAQAKAAAKAISALSNTKQMGTATAMYLNDFDDTYPLAAVLRPAGGLMGSGVAYPFPYNDGELISGSNATWQSAARQSMAQSFVNNAIEPYVKSYGLYALTGLQDFPTKNTYGSAGFVQAQYNGITFNGDLHKYNATAVNNPSAAVMWWPGNGAANTLGVAISNPALNCGNTVDDCMFTPGANPSAVVSNSGYAGDILVGVANVTASPQPFSNGKGPVVRCDTSAKSLPVASQNYPSYLNAAGAFTDPYAYYLTPSQAVGFGLTSTYYFGVWNCLVDGNTPDMNNWETGATSPGDYWCYFRPDRTK